MTSPDAAIRARRKLTNRLIAAHDAGRLRPFLDADANVIAGDGELIMGAEDVIEALSAQFRDPSFETYERVTETVTVDDLGARAAETGSWTARRKGEPPVASRGTYLAVWRLQRGQWVIESETFVTLGRS